MGVGINKGIDGMGGSMSRSFYVGEDMKQEDIHAKYESGVLRLSIPKAEAKKPEVEEKKYIAIEG